MSSDQLLLNDLVILGRACPEPMKDGRVTVCLSRQVPFFPRLTKRQKTRAKTDMLFKKRILTSNQPIDTICHSVKLFSTCLFVALTLLSLVIYSFSVNAQISNPITDLGWNADGTRIAAAYLDGQVKVLDVSANQTIFTLQRGYRVSVSWHPADPDQLAVASPEEATQIIDVTSGEVLHQFQAAVITYSVEFSPDGTRLLTSHASPDGGHAQIGFLHSYDIATGTEPVEFEYALSGRVPFATWSPDGGEIAGLHSGDIPGVIRFWDATTGQITDTISQLETFFDPEAGGEVIVGGFDAIDWSPDGARIVASDRIDIIIWDRVTLQKTLVVPFIVGVNDVDWSPDGQWIAVARGTDQLVQVFDAKTGNLVNEIPTYTETNVVAWNPSSTQLAYGTATELPEIVTNPFGSMSADSRDCRSDH